MPFASLNGLSIAYESHGPLDRPVILLVMGLGAQLTIWPDELVDALVGDGFRVVRFDNRDCGLSSKFEQWGKADLPAAVQRLMSGQAIEAPYRLDDMANDAVGLLDVLGIERAHVVGASMGGMIAQVIAGRRPERTASLVSIMSTSSRAGLPPGKPEAVKAILTRPESGDRAELVRHGMWLREMIGSPGYPADPQWLQRFVERNVDRSYYPEGVGRQYLAILASGDRVGMLRGISRPTLVIHGADDPLLPEACGRDVADLVPGARYESIPGMGHDLPLALCAPLARMIGEHCRRS
jgi:pimeloyl-ACP methyl ester carboxylesterase